MGMDAKTAILEQKTALGIEFGSTRIKAVLIGADNAPIASGDHEWENRYDNGVWTYTLEDIWTGLQDAYTKMAADVKEKYDITLTRVGAIGFSAMMHGYMAFDKAGNLLVPFRTWRNNITEEASEKLTDLFGFHIPQRWTIAHLYQAILNGTRRMALHDRQSEEMEGRDTETGNDRQRLSYYSDSNERRMQRYQPLGRLRME